MQRSKICTNFNETTANSRFQGRIKIETPTTKQEQQQTQVPTQIQTPSTTPISTPPINTPKAFQQVSLMPPSPHTNSIDLLTIAATSSSSGNASDSEYDENALCKDHRHLRQSRDSFSSRLRDRLPSFLMRRRNAFANSPNGRADKCLSSCVGDEALTKSVVLCTVCTNNSSSVSTPNATSSPDSRLLPASMSAHLMAPRPSVAGVGGTITTVTKSKRKTAPLPRLVAKNGTVNLFVNNIDRRQYVRDLFTTMIDIKWRYNLLAASLGFVFSWIFFACIWYIVLLVHRDLEPHDELTKWSPCIENVKSFSAALLFSIETQSTLGFGTRIISVECPGAIIIFCIQLIFGVVAECLIVGMVFAKLSRPAKRSQTIMFSKFATVCLRDGKLCLCFRVGDVRSKSHIIGATIRASLVSQRITNEGEVIPFYHNQLTVKIDDSKNNLLLIWPVTIVHVVDGTSPFFTKNSEQFSKFNFEIITVLEGTVESTGQSIQVRSSYLPSEVKWGYRFEPIVSTHGFGKYAQTIIDYNKFNKIIAVDTPTISASDQYKLIALKSNTLNQDKQLEQQNNNNNNDSNNNL